VNRKPNGKIFGGVLIFTVIVGLWWTDFGTRWKAEETVERMKADTVEVLTPSHPVHVDVDFSDLKQIDDTGLIFAAVGGALLLFGGGVVVVSLLQFRRSREF